MAASRDHAYSRSFYFLTELWTRLLCHNQINLLFSLKQWLVFITSLFTWEKVIHLPVSLYTTFQGYCDNMHSSYKCLWESHTPNSRVVEYNDFWGVVRPCENNTKQRAQASRFKLKECSWSICNLDSANTVLKKVHCEKEER